MIVDRKENKKPVTFDDPFHCFNCPHCDILIFVHKNELNCKIFRCGQYKDTGDPIPPHGSEEFCDNLVKNNLIYGCSKPFIYKDTYVEPCDYI